MFTGFAWRRNRIPVRETLIVHYKNDTVATLKSYFGTAFPYIGGKCPQ